MQRTALHRTVHLNPQELCFFPVKSLLIHTHLPTWRYVTNPTQLILYVAALQGYNLYSTYHPNVFFHLSLIMFSYWKKRSPLPGTLSLSIGIKGCHPAEAAYFKHQRLISRSSGKQALRLVERALVVKHSPTKLEFSWPVHSPVPSQVVLPLQGADGQVAGGDFHFLNMDVSCSSWDYYHGVILWGKRMKKVKAESCLDYLCFAVL